MCPLPNFRNPSATTEELIAAVVAEIDGYGGDLEMLSLYVDGSYFVDAEFAPNARAAIEHAVRRKGVDVFNIETLPSAFPIGRIEETRSRTNAFVLINVGIQSVDKDIRSYCVGSPFTEAHLGEMFDAFHRLNIGLRAYLLFKPPFLSEREAMTDIQHSIDICLAHAVDIVSVNPCKVSSGTLLETLFWLGLYRVGHYFSVARALAAYRDVDRVRVEMPSSDGCPGDVALPHLCDQCRGVWSGGRIQAGLSLPKAPACWVAHMNAERDSDWRDRAAEFWATEGPALMHTFRRRAHPVDRRIPVLERRAAATDDSTIADIFQRPLVPIDPALVPRADDEPRSVRQDTEVAPARR